MADPWESDLLYEADDPVDDELDAVPQPTTSNPQIDAITAPSPLSSLPAAKEKKYREFEAKASVYSAAEYELAELERLIADQGVPGLKDTILEGIKAEPRGSGAGGLGLIGAAVGTALRAGAAGAALGPVGASAGLIGAGIAASAGYLLSEPVVRPLANSLQGSFGQQFFATAGRLQDVLEKAQTGAASSEFEQIKYMRTGIPAYGDEPETVISKLIALRRRMSIIKSIATGTEFDTDAVNDLPAPTVGSPPETPDQPGLLGPLFSGPLAAAQAYGR